MPLPATIPQGARLMVRTLDGVDAQTGRQQFRDYIGHVRSWDGMTLAITRDPAANGSRPAQEVEIDRSRIVALKPIPERRGRTAHNREVNNDGTSDKTL